MASEADRRYRYGTLGGQVDGDMVRSALNGKGAERPRNEVARRYRRVTKTIRFSATSSLARRARALPQVYGLLGISGSQTGGQGVIDISIPELVQSGQTGISSSWPLNIPRLRMQTEYKLNVPSRTRWGRRVVRRG